MHILKILIKYFLLISFLLSKDNIQFSANFLENIIEHDIEKRIFKDNVIVKKGNLLLYADRATYIPSLGEVILNNNVKMIDVHDSLMCNYLVLYDQINNQFRASGDVQFYKNKLLIKSNYLDYLESINKDTLNINLYDNAQVIDLQRQISGDTLIINYLDSIIQNIHIRSNAQCINSSYAKYKYDQKLQPLEDKMLSKQMYIDFNNGELNEINLNGMVETTFNVIEDSLVTGMNISSGDSINIKLSNNSIDRMEMYGGVKGKFIPEKYNSDIDSTVVYSADYIDYQINNQQSYLYDDAMVDYNLNQLKSGKIFVDWETNLLEATIKDSISPSINGFGEKPIYGNKMIFDLISNKGKIITGTTSFNDSFYTGEIITKNKEQSYYINNSLYTTCDLEEPHYYFHSNKMKMIPNDRIIAKPMVLYIQELPLIYMPFAVLPNKNGDRISGWIMPSFGHKKDRGTYLDDLGYYYVMNDYADFTILFDIQDRYGVMIDQHYRYKVQSGNYWYNYYLDGFIRTENKYYLSEDDNNISNIFSDNSKKIKNLSWQHKQSFDPSQNIFIKYHYKSELDAKEINLNKRLEQNQLTSLSYQKRWSKNSLNIGLENYEDLYLAKPTSDDQFSIYKWYSGPRVDFSMPQRKIIGDGDKWYNDLYVSYGLFYDHGKESYIKNACINSDQNNYCDDSNNQLIDDNQYFWASEDSINIKKGSAKNTLRLSMNSKIGFLTIYPKINIIEDWSFQYRQYDDINHKFNDISGFNRRLTWDSSISLNTNLYGIIPFNFLNFISLRHKASPSLTFSYIPDLRDTYDNQLINYKDINGDSQVYDILGGGYVKGLNTENRTIRFSMSNLFQAKKYTVDEEIKKIDILDMNIGFDYHNNSTTENHFSTIDSRWSFKKENGSELFQLNVKHNMYDQDTNQLLIKKGKLPRFESLKFNMSSNFRLSGSSFQNTDILYDSTSQDTIQYNSILYMDEFKPQIESNELWRSDITLSIKGEYEQNIKDWEFDFLNMDMYNTIHLTKNWLLTYATGINLIDMKINAQSVKFYRELHCWEFMFTWWPDGGRQGFQLSINVKHPDLKDIRIKSSSANRKF